MSLKIHTILTPKHWLRDHSHPTKDLSEDVSDTRCLVGLVRSVGTKQAFSQSELLHCPLQLKYRTHSVFYVTPRLPSPQRRFSGDSIGLWPPSDTAPCPGYLAFQSSLWPLTGHPLPLPGTTIQQQELQLLSGPLARVLHPAWPGSPVGALTPILPPRVNTTQGRSARGNCLVLKSDREARRQFPWGL